MVAGIRPLGITSLTLAALQVVHIADERPIGPPRLGAYRIYDDHVWRWRDHQHNQWLTEQREARRRRAEAEARSFIDAAEAKRQRKNARRARVAFAQRDTGDETRC
jgi:hypothetical protein